MFFLTVLFACGGGAVDGQTDNAKDSGSSDTQDTSGTPFSCTYVESEWGDEGTVEVTATPVVSGLATPWGLAWMPDGRMLLTERDGRISVVTEGALSTVAELDVTASGEGGLLGLALHPEFSENGYFFVYATVDAQAGGTENQVQRWHFSGAQATFDKVIFGEIPARQFHNGGRLRIGPDQRLYVGTGDAGKPSRSRDKNDPAGKILRLELDGSIPADNPFPDSATWIYGIRNTQGFDWRSDGKLLITDHGPSGLPAEQGRSDHDEVSLAQPGDNLGWPDIYACETEEGMVTPSITFGDAMPPGGAAIYTGSEVPEWKGDLLIGVLGFGTQTRHLHRLRLSGNGNVEISEVYFSQDYGRMREVIMGPDGGLYVTTSNCDGRGDCGDGDLVLRVGR